MRAVEKSEITIAIVEDNLSFQSILRKAVMDSPHLILSAVAGNCAQAMEILKKKPLDVLLVDLGLPDGSGVDVIRAANLAWPNCNIMVSTAFGDEMNVIRSLEAGAAGYLLKDSNASNIVNEIRTLHEGGSPISPLIARQILMRFRGQERAQMHLVKKTEGKSSPALSAREQTVLEYIAKGFTSDEIATLLLISRHTVLTFVRRIYTKLEVNSKMEAVYEAQTLGLISR